MTFTELRRLIADDWYADRFRTRKEYRLALLLESVKETIAFDGNALEREHAQQDVIQAELKRLRS